MAWTDQTTSELVFWWTSTTEWQDATFNWERNILADNWTDQSQS